MEPIEPDYRPHVIETRDIRGLCFEINNILRGGMARQSAVDPSEIGANRRATYNSSYLDQLCADLSEERLSRAVLRLAVYVRTFDDIMNAGPVAEQYSRYKQEVEARFVVGHYVKSDTYASEVRPGQQVQHEFHLADARNIRRCCGHIIHAQDFRPTYDETAEGVWSMDGILAIEGKDRGEEWYIELDAFAFMEAVLNLVAFHQQRLS